MLLPALRNQGTRSLDQASLRYRRRALLTRVVRRAGSHQINQLDNRLWKRFRGDRVEPAMQFFGERALVRPAMVRAHDIAEPEDREFATLVGHDRHKRFETLTGPASLAGNGYQEMNETDKDEFPSAHPITKF